MDALVEFIMAVVVALVSTIGFGWTFLLVVGTFALGLVLAGSQVLRVPASSSWPACSSSRGCR